MTKLLFTRHEVAELLGLSVATVESLTKSGQLAIIRIGRSVRVSAAVLEEFCKTGTPGKTAHGANLHPLWTGKK